MAILLETVNLQRDYRIGSQSVSVLKGVNLQLFDGETVSLVGKSGVGKTTLLQLLGLLDTPTAGKILLRGEDVGRLTRARRAEIRRKEIGFVFQFYHLIRELTALENVMLSGRIGASLIESIVRRHDDRERAMLLLKRVGLDHRHRHRPSQLSGGELQRVAIARALYAKPSLLLCDEPTGNLDTDTGASILELLFGLQDELNTTLLLVTHDPELARRCGRVVRLVNGQIDAVEMAGR
ncbi:MAG: ABC transporter ATP-binding protein [Planctomycetota bacterium]